MGVSSAEERWSSLSARARVYLEVLFDGDEKLGGPEAWRWLEFGGVPRGDRLTPIQRRLKEAGVLVPDALVPIVRLSQRGLLRVVRESDRTFVRLTVAGRDVGRTTAPPRHRRRVPGQLSREAWRSVARIHAAGPCGRPDRLLERRERRYLGRHRVPLAHASEREGEHLDLATRRVLPHQGRELAWTLTEAGQEHYDRHWQAYQWLHPEVVALDPAHTWETHVRTWRAAVEHLPDEVVLALEQIELAWMTAERVFRAARKSGLPSSQQLLSSVLGGRVIPIDGLGAWSPRRDLERDLERTVSAYWARLDYLRWYYASCHAILATEATMAALANVRFSLASLLPLMHIRVDTAGRPLVLPLPVTGDPELDSGIVRSHAIAAAARAVPEDVVEYGRHLFEMLHRARLAHHLSRHSHIRRSLSHSNGH